MSSRGQDNDRFTAECTSWYAPLTSRGTTTDNRARVYSPRDLESFNDNEDGLDNTPSHHSSPSLYPSTNYHAAVKQPDSTMPAKARLIKRPQSSGETHGFSYSVAQKVQLNMDRHFGAPKLLTKESDDNGTRSPPDEVQRLGGQEEDPIEDIRNLPTDMEGTQSSTGSLNVPAAMSKAPTSGHDGRTLDQAISVDSNEDRTPNHPLPSHHTRGNSLETSQTFVDQQFIESREEQQSLNPEVREIAQQHRGKPMADPPAVEASMPKPSKMSHQTPATQLVLKVADHPTPVFEGQKPHPAIRQGTLKPAKHRELPQDPGRVKKKRHTQPTGSSFEPTFDITSMEDMLNLLQFRIQRDLQGKRLAEEIHKLTEKNLEEVKHACHRLNIELRELREKDKTQGAELTKYRNAITSLKTKSRKFEDYVKGLSNDHHHLRDEAKDIQNQQKRLCIESATLQATVQDALNTVAQLPSTSRLPLEVKYELITKDQSLKEQASLLEETKQLLHTERERNQNLQTILLTKLSEISTRQTEVVEGSRSSHEIVINKLIQLLNSVNDLPKDIALVSAKISEHSQSILDRSQNVINLIKKTQDSGSDGMKNLDASLRAYTESTTSAIEQLNQSTKAYQSGHTDLDRKVEFQMKEIISALKAEKLSSEQLGSLRETRNVIQTELQASRSALAIANQSVAYLQNTESRHLQDIADLKTELAILRAQQLEASGLVLKLEAVEKANNELNNKAVKAQAEAEELKSQAIQHVAEASKAKQQIECLQSKLQQLERAKTNLEQEKTELEKQAAIDLDNAKNQLLKEANLERMSVAEDHSSAMHQMQQEVASTEKKCEELQAKCEELQGEVDKEKAISTNLASEIMALEAAAVESDTELAEVKAELGQAVEKGLTNDAEIESLKQNAEEIQSRSEDTQQSLLARISELESDRDTALRRINSACTELNPAYVPQTRLQIALEALMSLQASATESRPVFFSPQKPQGTHTQIRQATPQNQSSLKSPEDLKQRRKANRPPIARNHTALSQASDDNLLFDECRTRETTIHRTSSYTRTTSRQGCEVNSADPFQGIRSTAQESQLQMESQEHQGPINSQESSNIDTQDPIMRLANFEIDSQQIRPNSQVIAHKFSHLGLGSQLVDPSSPLEAPDPLSPSPPAQKSPPAGRYPSQLSPKSRESHLPNDLSRLSFEPETREPSPGKNVELPAQDLPRKKYGQKAQEVKKVQENSMRPPVNRFAPNLDLPASNIPRGTIKAPTALKRNSQTAGIHSASQPKRRVAFQGPSIGGGEPSAAGKKPSGVPAPRRSTRRTTTDKFSERFSSMER